MGPKDQASSYSRGLVFGMTMAEVMLLLVFVLAFAFAAISSRDRERIAEAEEKVKVAEKQAGDMKLAVEEFAPPKGATSIPSDWTELVAAGARAKAMEDAGLNVEEATMRIPDLKLLGKMDAAGINMAALAALAESGDLPAVLAGGHAADAKIADALKLQEAVAAAGLGNVTPEDVAQRAARPVNNPFSAKGSRLGQHDWPPIINLSEAGGYNFAVGRADLSDAFRNRLHGPVMDRLTQIIDEYNVDIVEVIGHTDEQRMGGKASNLDDLLVDVLSGRGTIDDVVPIDNAGLGMARAVSVASELRTDRRLADVRILPLSGAQLIKPGDEVTDGTRPGDEAARRRIEIRVRRSER